MKQRCFVFNIGRNGLKLSDFTISPNIWRFVLHILVIFLPTLLHLWCFWSKLTGLQNFAYKSLITLYYETFCIQSFILSYSTGFVLIF